MKSSVAKGDSLRDLVYSLVIAAQKNNCKKEVNLGGKNVDVYFEDVDLVRDVVRIAIECKNYEKKLNLQEVNKIITDYTACNPQNNHFDKLIILSATDQTPQSKQTLAQYPSIKFQTLDEFRKNLMDFGLYLQNLKASYKNDGLDKYYIPILTTQKNNLEEIVEKWIEDDSSKPIAILAGYGMGKSSFSKRLASAYAEKYLSGKSHRIPILLKLGDIHKEQGVSGLVCNYFSAANYIRGFYYETFLEFNKQGCFIIILDGFDEMKYAMDIDDFKFNISQFKTLIAPNSKVIILGRPNAFMSDNERLSVLQGIEVNNGKEYPNVNMASFTEIYLSEFSEEQSTSFVQKYLPYLNEGNRSTRDLYRSQAFIDNRIKELKSPEFCELISRPVHARMLCEIALISDGDISASNRYELYKQFIQYLFHRENEKQVRQKITIQERTIFSIEIAWYLWTNGGKNSFVMDDIPDHLFSCHYRDGISRDAIKREMILGSIIVSKGGNQFYFSHRSFQEYLVSEYILREEWSAKSIPVLSKSINSEISTFILESGLLDDFFNKQLDVLSIYNGELNQPYIKLLSEMLDPESGQHEIFEYARTNPWILYIFIEMTTKGFSSPHGIVHSLDFLVNLLNDQKNKRFDAAVVVCAIRLILLCISKNSKIESTFDNHNYYYQIIFSVVIACNLKLIRAANKFESNSSVVYSSAFDNKFSRFFCKSIIPSIGNEISLKISSISLFNLSTDFLKDESLVKEHSEVDEYTSTISLQSVLRHLSQHVDSPDNVDIRNFYMRYKKPQDLVPVTTKEQLITSRQARKLIRINRD